MADEAHIPVLVEELLTTFQPHPGDRLLDATLGNGGHAEAYLTATAPTGVVVGLDADQAALARARVQLQPFGKRVVLIHANFAQLNEALEKQLEGSDNGTFQHIIFDLGIGSHQLADTTRGFSFSSENSLSMRYGTWQLPSAQVEALNELERALGRLPDVADMLEHLPEVDLAEVIMVYGEERFRGRIARTLKTRPYPTTGHELAQRVTQAVPGHYRRGRLHPATRTFQALRLAVNRELEALTAALPQAYDRLHPGGILAVISFHSLEDRIVKHTFRRYQKDAAATILTKKPLVASSREVNINPRARSAKLRALQRAG